MEKKLKKEMETIISLLDDTSPTVTNLAREKLLDMGDFIYPALVEAYIQNENLEIKKALHSILKEINYEKVESEILFFDFENEYIALENLSFKIARLEYPTLQIENYKNLLSHYSDNIRYSVTANSSKLELLQGINWYLFTVLGLNGDTAKYYDPQNSYLNRVLDRKKGIPVTLSVIYMLVAHRLGLDLSGIALPGHFVLTVSNTPGKYYIDVFNKGKIISSNDCKEIIKRAGVGFEEKYLQPVNSREIISRILRNLIYVYKREQDDEQLLLYETLANTIESLGMI